MKSIISQQHQVKGTQLAFPFFSLIFFNTVLHNTGLKEQMEGKLVPGDYPAVVVHQVYLSTYQYESIAVNFSIVGLEIYLRPAIFTSHLRNIFIPIIYISAMISRGFKADKKGIYLYESNIQLLHADSLSEQSAWSSTTSFRGDIAFIQNRLTLYRRDVILIIAFNGNCVI